jgi:hypothetical protein
MNYSLPVLLIFIIVSHDIPNLGMYTLLRCLITIFMGMGTYIQDNARNYL